MLYDILGWVLIVGLFAGSCAAICWPTDDDRAVRKYRREREAFESVFETDADRVFRAAGTRMPVAPDLWDRALERARWRRFEMFDD